MTHGRWFVLVGTLALASSCDSGKSFDGGTPRNTGGTGTTTGGSTSTGGTTSGTGGTALGGDGGAAMGGDAGAPMGGDGGAGGAGPGCPDELPTQDDACDGLEGEGCIYEDAACLCAGTWQCEGTDVTDECDNDEPMSGECERGESCTHSEGAGFCICAGLTWNCPGN